jgi:EpsI family protein
MSRRYLLSIVLIIAGGIAGNILRYTEKMPRDTADFSVIPLVLEDKYYGSERPLSEETSEVLKADLATDRIYTAPEDKKFQLFIAYFKSQKYGSQIHSPKHCLPGGGWKIDQLQPFRLELSNGTIKNINLSIISRQGRGMLMLYWYETRSGTIRGEYGLKLDLVKNSLLLKPTDATIIRFTFEISGDTEQTTRKAVAIIDKFHPYIEQALPF